MKGLIALLLVSSSLAGCAEMIPNPPGYQEPVWIIEYHNFTLEDTNNSTLPEIFFGSNNTMFELMYIDITMNNTTTNVSYPIKGFASQDGFMFSSGFAPNMGNVSLHLIELKGFDYYCTIQYRIWNGGPYET